MILKKKTLKKNLSNIENQFHILLNNNLLFNYLLFKGSKSGKPNNTFLEARQIRGGGGFGVVYVVNISWTCHEHIHMSLYIKCMSEQQRYELCNICYVVSMLHGVKYSRSRPKTVLINDSIATLHTGLQTLNIHFRSFLSIC